MQSIDLAVNGTLMRGLELNANLTSVGGEFVTEAATAPCYRLWSITAPCYRLWSIDDRHPAMVRQSSGGDSIELEVWSVPADGLATLLLAEPPGLCIGKVELADGSQVLGVLGEPALCEGMLEITAWKGWRNYTASL